jgi:hypothetical protein
MAEKHEAIKKALGNKKGKTHTHGVHYERAANGGYIAHVHKHHGTGPHSEGHSHSEEHVLADKDALAEHLDQQMGDQPAAGEMEPPQEADAEQQQEPGAMPPQQGM